MEKFEIHRFLFNLAKPKTSFMNDEMSFQEWSEQFKSEVAKLGLPQIEDEELLDLMHMEGLSVSQAVAQYKEEVSCS